MKSSKWIQHSCFETLNPKEVKATIYEKNCRPVHSNHDLNPSTVAMDCAVWFAGPTVGVSKTTQRTSTKIWKSNKKQSDDHHLPILISWLINRNRGSPKKNTGISLVLKLTKRKPGMFLFVLSCCLLCLTLRSISQNLPTLSWSYLQQTDVMFVSSAHVELLSSSRLSHDPLCTYSGLGGLDFT